MAARHRPVNLLLRVHEVGWQIAGIRILQRVSFDVAKGEFIALMGRNGAGKSTLLDLVAALRPPSDGTIALEGRVLDEWQARDLARVMCHLPQQVRAEGAFTAEELVLMGRYPHSAGWTETTDDRLAAHRAMARCGCLEFRQRRLSTLSGGERQRVLLAACLAQDPKVLLLDEPATFLDIEQQLQCFSMLREEADRGGTCIAVTHDINLALTFCTRLLVLADRTLATDVSVDAAVRDPGWLRLFSPRLEVTRTAAGRPWVSFA
jgi:iron complex transport system ATP-binding protein